MLQFQLYHTIISYLQCCDNITSDQAFNLSLTTIPKDFLCNLWHPLNWPTQINLEN